MNATTFTARAARSELLEIIRRDIPFEAKARGALDVGRRYLGVENGHLTRIDPETDHWEALISTDDAGGQFPPGLELEFGRTYCRRVIGDDEQVALHDAPNQGWADDPAFEAHGLHCYLGTKLVVDGAEYGTVCFVSSAARADPFADDELLFAELVATLLERELEGAIHETRLARQTNLAIVLNRVLRHNLRNGLSVVRGYTQLLVDRLGGDADGQRALDRIDSLIDLSEKARHLDRVIDAEASPTQTDLEALVRSVADATRTSYPAATIDVACEESVAIGLLPSFERGLAELFENAAKHAGEYPTVTITVETVQNAVEIRVEDDGPGLSNQERAVLESGTETPLLHGSGLGLWLAHWIVTSHGGTIEPVVTTTGTRLTVTVPRTEQVGTNEQLHSLRRGGDLYQAAFEGARDAMVIVDDDGRILDANPAGAGLLGVGRQALLGRTLETFLAGEGELSGNLTEFHDGERESAIAIVERPDGERRTVEYTATEGIVPGHDLLVARDVTDRPGYAEPLATPRGARDAIVEATDDPVFVADAESGEIVDANAAATAFLDRPLDRIVGSHQSELHPPENEELYRRAFEAARERQGTLTRLPDGSRPAAWTADGPVPIEIDASTLHLPTRALLVGVFREVTDETRRDSEPGIGV